MKLIIEGVLRHWKAGWLDALASATAAALSWVLAQWLFDHPHPIFAAISAIVCLAPGLPNHGKQAVGLLLGVASGILIGELAFILLPDGMPVLRIGFAAFFAIMVAASFGLAPVVPIQAGVSAVLVLAIGPATAGSVRMLDVAVGTAVGLFFSQVLLTPDPVQMINIAARGLLEALAAGFSQCSKALSLQDAHMAQAALHQFTAAHDNLIELGAGIESARGAARWSLRGRLAAAQVNESAARYDRRAIRLYASTLLFGEALANALRKGEVPPAGLRERVEGVARECTGVAREGLIRRPNDFMTPSDTGLHVPPSWRLCVDHLHAVEGALKAFEAAPEGPDSPNSVP